MCCEDLVDLKGSVGTGNKLAICISAQGTEFTYVDIIIGRNIAGLHLLFCCYRDMPSLKTCFAEGRN